MRRLIGLVILSLTLMTAPAFHLDRPVRAQAPAAGPLRTAGDRPIDIQHIRLDLRVDLPKKTVAARATLRLRSLRPIAAISLDAVGFEVSRVLLGTNDKDGSPVPFAHDDRKLVIDLDPSWPADHAATLRIDYRVREPKAGLYFFGPTKAEPDVPLTVWSQGEATTNRYWFPCLDQPNQRQTTELVVTAADGFEVVSNGRLVARRTDPVHKTVTFHWLQDKPHAAYLVTLVVGQFDVVREEWRHVPVLYYVPRGHKDDVARTFGRTRAMLGFFSRRFGIDYPWDKYAQVVVEQFTAGGMENTSATSLTDRALHDARSMLDSSPDRLIAHEMAHQWWGDLLTCRDWAHIWLNEGFASYGEVLWVEHHEGADEGAYDLWQKSREATAGDKNGPVVDRHYSSAFAVFDARAYPKGAWVLHMLRRRLGDDVFWKCLRRYGTEHRLQSVDTDDFRKTLEQQTGRSLERFFYDWTERPGHPVLEVATEYLPETHQARVAVKQTQTGEAFQFPLKIAFTCAGAKAGQAAGKPLVVEEPVNDKSQVFFVPLPGRPAAVELDPDQAVLAEINEQKGRELWLSQLSGASGVAARIRAAQHFGQSKAPADREALAAALMGEKFWGVQAQVAAALGESGGDAARDALVRGLKHAHPKVRRACAEQLGRFRHDATAAAALKSILHQGDASYFVEAAALGAYAQIQPADAVAVLVPWLDKPSYYEVLRSAVLAGLGKSQDPAALDTLLAWSKRGKCRTCRVAALLALAELAQTGKLTDAQQKQLVTAVADSLEGETPTIRRSAVMALSGMGRLAAPARGALETISRHDPLDGMRELARRAVDQVRSNTPVPSELSRLREELDQLKRSNEQLRERLDKFDKVQRKGA
ncbi:MAG TPA: M1 family aminopeptidase [Gemmataceae bacterium]|nr:M1 family aminopeptidase [Gemmataceae bacterium]